MWGCSSVVRATGSQSVGRGFNPRHLHTLLPADTVLGIKLTASLHCTWYPVCPDSPRTRGIHGFNTKGALDALRSRRSNLQQADNIPEQNPSPASAGHKCKLACAWSQDRAWNLLVPLPLHICLTKAAYICWSSTIPQKTSHLCIEASTCDQQQLRQQLTQIQPACYQLMLSASPTWLLASPYA